MIFSPECDHCDQVLDSLKTMTQALAHTQAILVTEARHKEAFITFRKSKGLNTSNLFTYWGWDTGNLIYYIYTYRMLPQINIYNSRHTLLKTFAGNFPLDSLRMYLK